MFGTALVSDEAFFEPIDTLSVSLSQHSIMYDQFWEPLQNAVRTVTVQMLYRLCVCVLTVCVVQHRGFAIATYPWVCVQEPLVPTLL